MKLDSDILFNTEPWEKIISSQINLFSKDSLINISNGIREEFHSGHAPNRKPPMMPKEAIIAPELLTYADHICGYDLPCLISGSRPSRGLIMFCAQDPLRRLSSPIGISVGTFFGFDHDHLRCSLKHYGVLWQLIRRCVAHGYDVWLTDAMKIHCIGNKISPELHQLCEETLRSEVDLAQPERIVAFGGRAKRLFGKILKGDDRIIYERHPSAWGSKRQWALEGATHEYEDSPLGRFNAQVDRYCRDIFGEDLR